MRGLRAILLILVGVPLLCARGAAADDPLPPPRAVPSGPPAAAPAPAPAPRPGPPVVVPAPVAYRLVAGDEIEIEVILQGVAAGDNPMPAPKRLLVGSVGTVDLPKVRGLVLAGRSPREVSDEITAKLAQAGVGTSPEVYVRVTQYAKRYVSIVGAAFVRVEVSAFERTRLVDVLAEAGDALREADTKRVVVISPGAPPRTVDLVLVYGAGASSPDAFLSPGDAVVLLEKPKVPDPVVPRVWIFGFVKDSGPRRYFVGDRADQPMTLLRLIADAGGPSEYGDLSNVTIRRSGEGGPIGTARRVDVEKILKGVAPDEVLQANDIVYVGD